MWILLQFEVIEGIIYSDMKGDSVAYVTMDTVG